MSPRPAPSPDDDLARVFLAAGARLVDALLTPHADLPPRLRTLHFPAPLGWIRVEDVIREARAGGASVSAKAFWNRWPDKDSYLVDLAGWAITHPENGTDSAPASLDLRAAMAASDLTFSQRIEALTRSVMQELLAQPRSPLFGHLAAVVHHAPGLAEPLTAEVLRDSSGWSDFYQAAVESVGLAWRPGWDAAQGQLVVRALIDGLLVAHRTSLQPDGRPWDIAEVYGAAVTAFFVGVLDLDGDGRTVAQVLDDGVAAARGAGVSASS